MLAILLFKSILISAVDVVWRKAVGEWAGEAISILESSVWLVELLSFRIKLVAALLTIIPVALDLYPHCSNKLPINTWVLVAPFKLIAWYSIWTNSLLAI